MKKTNKLLDYDMGYNDSEWRGINCYDLNGPVSKRKSKKVQCATKKYIYPCTRFPCIGKNNKIGFASRDRKRQNYYRKILTDYCKKSPMACSDTDADGYKQSIDPICFEINQCSISSKISDIPKVAKKTLTFFEELLDLGLNKQAKELLRDRSRRKQRRRELKNKSKTKLEEMKMAFENSSNKCESLHRGGSKKVRFKNNIANYADNNKNILAKELETNADYDNQETACLPKKLQCNVNCFDCAFSKYKHFSILKDARKYTKSSFGYSFSKEKAILAQQIIDKQIENIEKELRPLSINYNNKKYNGFEFFKLYLDENKKLRGLTSSGRISGALDSLTGFEKVSKISAVIRSQKIANPKKAPECLFRNTKKQKKELLKNNLKRRKGAILQEFGYDVEENKNKYSNDPALNACIFYKNYCTKKDRNNNSNNNSNNT